MCISAQPGKTFYFHTKEFIQGYMKGFCSAGGPDVGGMDENEASFDCVKTIKNPELGIGIFVEGGQSYMVQTFVNARNRLQVTREMKTTVISALAIIILLSAIAPNVMASQGYWTANNALVPPGMKKYHIFLDGTYRSSTNRSTKLTNDGLRICSRSMGIRR